MCRRRWNVAGQEVSKGRVSFVSWIQVGRGLTGLAVVIGTACAAGDGSRASGPGLGHDDQGADAGLTAADDPGAGGETGEPGGATDGGEPVDCGGPGTPPCDCEAVDDQGQYVLGPCHPACMDSYRRWSLWTTNYNVDGTLGYGEHQGNGIIGYAYHYDTRFGPDDGLDPPWRTASGEPWSMDDGSSDAQQFAMRTQNPAAEHYVEAVVLPGDEDDLWLGETLPTVPVSQIHPIIEAAALCEAPQTLIDVRHYNHGRTLAQTVPNHGWDSFFNRRSLIPLALLEVVELLRTRDGVWSSSTLVRVSEATPAAVDACMAIIDDGFCDARCGNCSYVMPTGFTGLPFGGPQPGHQIADIPSGSVAPYQTSDAGLVAKRTNWSVVEDQHAVWYVGGSVWGMADEAGAYADYEGWPDPDGVPVQEPGDAWVTVAGDDDLGGDGVPDEWDDPFTHCVDPSDGWGSQRPAGLPGFISGRWGHNSNSDAEASYRQFMGCRVDPVAAVEPGWTGPFACDACGLPRVEGAETLIQYPCRDKTHTATSYWDRSPGTHDIEDFDPGKFDAVDATRVPTARWSDLPRPVCRTSGEPVYGM